MENIIAIASSNPKVVEKFYDYDIICQKDVLGFENEKYTDLSWGEFIRNAVKDNVYETFKMYAAAGVEKILTFEEIKSIYNQSPFDMPAEM